MSDLKPYDVVTYDSSRNVLVASELRISCVPEDITPSLQYPTTIKALGNTFQVLQSAWDNSDEIKTGKQVVLCLTADGKVAAIKTSNTDLRANAFGIAEDSSVTITLPVGGSLILTGQSPLRGNFQGKLVSVSSWEKGELTVSALSTERAPGDFDIAAMTLGSYKIAAGAQIYEQARDGYVSPISTAQIQLDKIPREKISYYHLNNSGMVDCLVINDVTGESYTYGMLIKTEEPLFEEGRGNFLVTVENGGNSAMPTVTDAIASEFTYRDGDFGGVAAKETATYGTRATSVVVLSPLATVSRSSFYEKDGAMYVRANGKTYEVSENVVCYNSATKTWYTGDNPLAKARAYSENLTIYIDPMAEMVRIVTVK